MTLKELGKWVHSNQETETDDPKMVALLQRVRKSSFFNFFEKDHKKILDSNATIGRNCPCFNCIIRWPQKNGRYYPMWDYENSILKAIETPAYINSRKPTEEDNEWFEEQRNLIENSRGINNSGSVMNAYDKLLKERHDRLIHPQKIGKVAILKSAGLGLTSFTVRYICWKAMKDDSWKGKDVIILTGPRQSLSNDIISMMKNLFLHFGITFDTDKSTLILNGVRIRAFPSDHLSAARGIPEPVCIYCDEASHFSPQSQKEVIDVIERYAGKSPGCKIILTSTPNKVGDLMHTILSQPFEESFYKIMRLSYEWGINKVYTEEDIKTAKASSSFEREYNLSFNSPSGNCFSHKSIDAAVARAKNYPDIINKTAEHSLGCDPGFGSSSFALVCLEHSDSIIKVVYAKQFERTGFNDMLQEIWNVRNLVGSLDNVYIDAANVEFIEAVKQDFNESTNWQYIHDTLAKYKKMNLRVETVMKVVPVSFAQEGPSMLVHVKNLLDHEDNLLCINPKHEELISALKGAVSTEYKLNKQESVFSDLTDAFRLAAKFFKLEK